MIPLLALLFCCFCCSGCALVPDVRLKPQIINPFPQIRTVAVLPFVNQSEEPTLSGDRVALAYMNELQQIRGFEVLPLGVVKIKLQEFGRPLMSGKDFQAFAQFLGVDAVLIGSVTDYDPYYPPRMTMKVSWYAANESYHPIPVGYGIPWGTKEEKKIPRWVHYEAQRELAAAQLETQEPVIRDPAQPQATTGHPPSERDSGVPSNDSSGFSISTDLSDSGDDAPPPPPSLTSPRIHATASEWQEDDIAAGAATLPPNWPDPNGFIPDPPAPEPPPYLPQHEPIISHMRSFNGHDDDFTEQLADYYYFRDDARFGGWQAYLQRSEDFIRFCCYLHLRETLIARGGRDKSRLILRWPIDRYRR